MKQPNEPYSRIDQGWQNMEAILEKEMPSNKRRYIIFFWLLAGIAITFALTAGLYNRSVNNSPLVQETSDHSSPANLSRSAIENKKSTNHLNNTLTTNDSSNKSSFENSLDDEKSYNAIISNTSELSNNSLKLSPNEKTTLSSSNSLIKSDLPLDRKEVNQEKPFVLDAKIENNNAHRTKKEMLKVEVAKSKNNLAVLPNIKMIPFRIMAYKNSPELSIGFANNSIKINEDFDSGIHLGAVAGGEYIFNFSSPGFMTGVFIEKNINRSLSIGTQLAYSINKRSITDENGLLNQGVNNPTAEDSNIGAITNEESVSLLKSSTRYLNAWMVTIFTKYEINNGLAFRIGVGLDFYNDHLRLINLGNSELSLSSENLFQLEKGNKIIPTASLGIEYNLIHGLSLFAEYRTALNYYYTYDMERLNTTKATLGLSFRI